MFYWKFTRSGKFNRDYISLILDFLPGSHTDEKLEVSFEDCKNILILMHDVEKLNSMFNISAGLDKPSFQEPISEFNYKVGNEYQEKRQVKKMILGQGSSGRNSGSKLDYGFCGTDRKQIELDLSKLEVGIMIDAKTGTLYGSEDKLKHFRSHSYFIKDGKYFDLMPKHNCIKEIVSKMLSFNQADTINFLENELGWHPLEERSAV